MKRILPATALLALAVAAGCSRDEATPKAEAPASAPAPAASSPAPAATAAPAAQPTDPQAAFDVGAFTGTFANGRTRLELHADGTYLLDAEGESGRGTWTHENGIIRLDPGTKDALDRVFRIQAKDQLAPVPDPGQMPLPVLSRLAAS